MIEQSEDLRYIQSQHGRLSPTVKLNAYIHLVKDVNEVAACRLNNAIFQTARSKMAADK